MKLKKVKLRLRKVHYLNGVKKSAGKVISLDASSAKWLVDKKVAVQLK